MSPDILDSAFCILIWTYYAKIYPQIFLGYYFMFTGYQREGDALVQW